MKKNHLVFLAILLIAILTSCSSTKKENSDKTDKNDSSTKQEQPVTKENPEKTIKSQNNNLIDAEELLPKEEVEKVLGIEIKNVKHRNNETLGMSGMDYYNEDREQSVWFHCFQQPAVPNGSDFNVKKQYQENKENAIKFESAEMLDDLGDDAYYAKMDKKVCILMGDYSFGIADSLSDLDEDGRKENAMKLAKIIETNLKKKLEK
ncbi:hypothetical protein EII17_09535 [Clostridiales bacterium COT073_COT-073]|nr:hypothetical protein EII17_09535 [Clostridiales bacterium COT073_COT-073]